MSFVLQLISGKVLTFWNNPLNTLGGGDVRFLFITGY